MRNTATELEVFLNDLAAGAKAGDRLPAVRDLMKRFGLSQLVVQRVFHNMKERGLIDILPGRGMFFLVEGTGAGSVFDRAHARDAGAAAKDRSRSILLLRRSVNIDRGRPFIEKLNRRFSAGGHKVIEVSFSDPVHAKTVLRSLPRFDACVIQSVYQSIPSDMVAMIQEKTPVVAFDGVAMVADGVDSVGTEWGEPLAEAVDLLRRRGHRRLCFAATEKPFVATTLGLRRCEYLNRALSDTAIDAMRLPYLPDEGYVEALVDELRRMRAAHGRLPFTALIAWGVSDGARLLELLNGIGVSIPGDLSVVLIGRTDLANEHAGFFEMFGPRVEDQVDLMFDAISRRWIDPSLPYGVHLAPVTYREGVSVSSVEPGTPPAAY